MADERLLTEIDVDAAPAVKSIDEFIGAATMAAEASERIVVSTDDLSESLTRSASAIKASEQALATQATAAGGAAGIMLALRDTSAQLAEAQAEVARMVSAGGTSWTQGANDLALLLQREEQVADASRLLASGTISAAEAMQRFPAAFSASAESANQLVSAFARINASLDPAFSALNRLAESYDTLRAAQSQGLITSERFIELQSRLAGVQAGGPASNIADRAAGIAASADAAIAAVAAFSELSNAFNLLQASVDPTFAALTKLADSYALLREAQSQGIASTSEFVEVESRLTGSLQAPASSLAEHAAQLRQLSNAYSQLNSQLDPTFAALDKLAQQYRMLGEAMVAGNVSPTRALQQQEQLLGGVSAPTSSVAAHQQELAEAAAAEEKFAQGAAAIRAAFPSLNDAVAQFDTQLAQLQQYLNAGAISETQFAQASRQLGQSLGQQVTAIRQSSAAITESGAAQKEAEKSGASWRAGSFEIEHVIRAMTDAVNAGIPPLTALRLEMPRIAEAFTLTFGGSLINPITIGLAALGVAAYEVGTRAAETAQNLRVFAAGAQLMGTTALASGEDLQKMFERVRDFGAGTTTAMELINTFRSSPIINPAWTEQLSLTSEKLSILATGGFGQSKQKADELKTAIDGGIVTLTDYAVAINAMSGSQASAIKEAALWEGAEKGMTTTIKAIIDHVNSLQLPLSQFQELMREVRKAYNDFIDELAKQISFDQLHSALATIRDQVILTIKDLTDMINLVKDAYTFLKDIGNLIEGSKSALTPGKIQEEYKGILPQPGQPGGGPAAAQGQEIAQSITTALQNINAPGAPGVAANDNLTLAMNSNVEQGKTIVTAMNNLADKINQQTQTQSESSTRGAVEAEANKATAAATSSTEKYSSAIDTSVGDLKTLNDILKQAAQTLPEGYRVAAISGYRPGATIAGTTTPSLHAAGEALDVQIFGPQGAIPNIGQGPGTPAYQIYQQLAVAAYRAGQQIDPSFQLGWGGNFRGIGGGNALDLMHFQRGDVGAGGTLASEAAAYPDTGIVDQNTTAIKKHQEAVQDDAVAIARRLEVVGKSGLAQAEATARQNAETEAVKLGLDPDSQKVFVQQRVNEVLIRAQELLQRQTDLNAKQVSGDLEVAKATEQGSGAIAAQNAVIAAGIETIQRRGSALRTGANAQYQSFLQEADTAQRAAEIQNKTAGDAIKAAATQSAALDSQIANEQRLADATRLGAKAKQEQQVANEAAKLTDKAALDSAQALIVAQNDLTQAQKVGNAAAIARAQTEVDLAQKEVALVPIIKSVTQARLDELESAKQTVALEDQTNKLKDQAAIIQVQLGLQGQSTAEISKQVALLKARLDIEEHHALSTKESQQAYLAQVASTAKLEENLKQAEAAQHRLNDAARGIADTINNQIGTALDNAFSGKKAQNWGDTMKTIINDILKQIVEFTLIQPAIGTALRAVGLTQAAQQFGSFGNLFGGGAGGAGGGSSGILGDAFNAVGLGSKVAGLFGGGDTGGGGIFSGISNLFGGGGGGALGAGEGIFQGGALGTTLETSIGGTFASDASAASLADIAGVGGSAGGGILGGIGSAISAALPFAGIAVGLGSLIGGLTGIFGGRPSNRASGIDIGVATGSLGGFGSGGVAQYDQAVQQAGTTLQNFIRSVNALIPGGTPGGAINIQQGTRGIQAEYSGPLGDFKGTFADMQTAINDIETAIVNNLQNVSGTLKTVLQHVTDPSQLQAAVTFAQTYDNLKNAVDNAFKNVPGDITNGIGPFQQALQQLNTTFAQLAQQAQQFGLSLAPINSGLQIATQRLQTDFGKALDTIIAGGTSSDYISQLQTVSATFATNITDAISIGLGDNQDIQAKIRQAEAVQAEAVLGGLTTTQLQDVVNKLQTTNPEIAQMAQQILNAGTASLTAGSNVANFAAQLKSLSDVIISLQSGPLSGLKPADAVSAATTTYNTLLRAVQGGATGQIGDLATAASTALQAYQSAYGEGPRTGDFRRQILAQLQAIQASNPQAPGVGLANVPSVSAAQAAAAVNASIGAASIVSPGFAVGVANDNAVGFARGTHHVTHSAHHYPATHHVTHHVTHHSGHHARRHFEEGTDIPGFATGTHLLGTFHHGFTHLPHTHHYHPGTYHFSPTGHAIRGFQHGTPPGIIKVGEAGPEWMLPANSNRWIQVGQQGEELLNQRGGAVILPYPQKPPSFQSGTLPAAQSYIDNAILLELRALRSELINLKTANLGVGQQAMRDATLTNRSLTNIDKKTKPLLSPSRQQLPGTGTKVA